MSRDKFEIRKVLGQVKDSLQCSLKRESHLTEQVKLNHIRDLENAILILDSLQVIEPKDKKPKFIQTRIDTEAEAAILQILSKGKAKRTVLTSEYYKLMKKPLRAEDLAYLVRIGKIERIEYGVYQLKQ